MNRDLTTTIPLSSLDLLILGWKSEALSDSGRGRPVGRRAMIPMRLRKDVADPARTFGPGAFADECGSFCEVVILSISGNL